MITGKVTHSGLIERILFFNEQTGFCVFIFKPDELTRITVRGVTSSRFGDRVTCEGEWEIHPVHGHQLVATSIIPELPSSKKGLENYLASGVIRGVGPAISKRIVNKFGEKTIDVLDNDIDKVKSVRGISKKVFEQIKSGWIEHSAMRSILIFLRGHEISQTVAYKIYRAYESSALEVIKTNPWKLARDITGIGFKKADEIAIGLGADLLSPSRIEACLSYVVDTSASSGHCGIPFDDAVKQASELLDLPIDFIQSVCSKLKPLPFVLENDMAWNRRLYRMEKDISDFITRLSSTKPLSNFQNIDNEIASVEKHIGCTLADNQRLAMKLQLSSRAMIITGGPGCGKTFLLNSILTLFRRHGLSVILSAPTGKAAARMTEATGYQASTLHRLLKLGHRSDVPEELDCDLLVIDEFSMVDVDLFHKVTSSLSPKASLLIVGDVDQLPSVGAGAVLNDLIRSNKIPCVILNKVFRQAQNSQIVLNAHRINNGEMILPQTKSDDFFFIETDTPENASLLIKDLVSKRLPKTFGYDPLKDIQVLCPMNKSTCGTWAMNSVLQESLNPYPSAAVKHFDTRIGVGDKVMQTVNNYQKGVFNGDSGYVVGVQEGGVVLVQFQIGIVPYEKQDMDELVLSFAMTIHKSQGSDFPVVVMPLLTSHYIMLQRNLVYTGLTRARKLCVVVGQKRAIGMAVKNNTASKRNTRLLQLL